MRDTSRPSNELEDELAFLFAEAFADGVIVFGSNESIYRVCNGTVEEVADSPIVVEAEKQ